jgi:hypothetical protein
MKSVCAVDLRKGTRGGNPSTSGVSTLGESEWGEVETPEGQRAEVIYSHRSVGDMRQRIVDFRCKHSRRKRVWRG